MKKMTHVLPPRVRNSDKEMGNQMYSRQAKYPADYHEENQINQKQYRQKP